MEFIFRGFNKTGPYIPLSLKQETVIEINIVHRPFSRICI